MDDLSLAEALALLVHGLTNDEISEATAIDAMAALVREESMLPRDDEQSSLASEFDDRQQIIITQVHDLIYRQYDWAAACHRLADLHELVDPLINERFVFTVTPARVELNAEKESIRMTREEDDGSLPH